jgi:serine protease Do
LYFGRADPVQDPRWDEPLLRLSALQETLPAGVAVFTLDARFIGLGMPDGRDVLVVPAGALKRAADRLSRGGSIVAASLGTEVQPLDSALIAATGADRGVIVSYVAARGASAGRLAIGDVIRRVGGSDVRSMSDYRTAIVSLEPGKQVAVEIIRHGAPLTVSITPLARTESSADVTGELGLELRTVRGIGAEVVRVAPRSAAARAGILPGDLITMAGDATSPDARRITRAFNELDAGQHIVFAVDRGASHLVVALAKP